MHLTKRTNLTLCAAMLAMTCTANAAELTSAEAASKVAAQFHAALATGNAEGASALLSATALIYESGHAERVTNTSLTISRPISRLQRRHNTP